MPSLSLIQTTAAQLTTSPGTPATNVSFIILGLAVALSTYLSVASRELTRSIGRDFYHGRVKEGNEKSAWLWMLMLADLVFLWGLILFPSLWLIGHWFITLEPTSSYFASLRWWLLIGLMSSSALMFGLHLVQEIRQRSLVKSWQHQVKARLIYSNDIKNDLDLLIGNLQLMSPAIDIDKDILSVFWAIATVSSDHLDEKNNIFLSISDLQAQTHIKDPQRIDAAITSLSVTGLVTIINYQPDAYILRYSGRIS